MKIGIYFSGIVGTILIVMRIIGILFEFQLNQVFLISGLVLLLMVFLPLSILHRRHYHNKIHNIIESYKGVEKKPVPIKKLEKTWKGWGMNNSPFRERKSGLVWGGGNIKGATAKRTTRRTFMK